MMEWIISSSVIMIIVIAMRAVLQGRISPKLQYALWAVVLVRLLIPVSLFQSNYSVMNILSQDTITRVEVQMDTPILNDHPQTPRPNFQIPQQNAPVQGGNVQNPQTNISNAPQNPITNGNPAVNENQNAKPDVTPNFNSQNAEETVISQITTSLSWKHIVTLVWATGTVIMASVLLWANLSLDKRLKQNRRRTRVTRKLPSYVTDQVATPCLFGLKRPVIYLTAETEDEETMAHVLAHELTHYKHKDHIWSALRCICLCLHWYNPLAWICASLSKKDAELACDESTIRSLGEDQRVSYGETLIRMTCAKRESRDLLLTATTMSLGKRTLKDRIRMIAKNPKTAAYTMIAVILILTVAVGCTFSGTANTPEETTPLTETTEIACEILYDENNLPYSVITCTDSEGNIIWTHETEHLDPDGEFNSFGPQPIGRLGENYCYTNGHKIVALDAKTGKIAWINEDIENSYYVGNTFYQHTIDPNGILWFTPAYYPYVYAISPTGETLNTVNTDYYFCCDLYYENESINLGLSHYLGKDSPDTILTIPIDSISPKPDTENAYYNDVLTDNDGYTETSEIVNSFTVETEDGYRILAEEYSTVQIYEYARNEWSSFVLTCTDPQGNVIWTHESEMVEYTEIGGVKAIGISGDRFFFQEDGIVALDIKTGKKLFTSDFVHRTDGYTTDDQGNLTISADGAYGNGIYVINSNGNTIYFTDELMDCAYLEYIDGMLYGYDADYKLIGSISTDLSSQEIDISVFELGMSEEDFLRKAEEIGLKVEYLGQDQYNEHGYSVFGYNVYFTFSEKERTLCELIVYDIGVSTAEGLRFGDSFERMIEIYGAPDHTFTELDIYEYYIDSNHLTVYIDDGYVSTWILDKDPPVEERIAISFTPGLYEEDFLQIAYSIRIDLEDKVFQEANCHETYKTSDYELYYDFYDGLLVEYWTFEDIIPTAEGLYVGDSIDRMIEIYGTDYKKDVEDYSVYQYQIDDCYLNIFYVDGVITSWSFSVYPNINND